MPYGGITKKMIMGSGGGGTKASTQAKRMADLFVETNSGPQGQVTNPNVYAKAAELLEPFSDDLTVAKKIASLKNKMRQLNADKEDALNSVVVFDANLKAEHQNAVSQSMDNPRALIGSLAKLYQEKASEFDKKVYMPMVDDALKRGTTPNQSIQNRRKELSDKADNLIRLSNSYNAKNPVVGVPGPSNAGAFGVFMTTNPENGNVINVDVNRVASTDDVPTGFIESESRFSRIPIYLNYVGQNKDKASAKLGDTIYQANDDGVLTMKKGKEKEGVGLIEKYTPFDNISSGTQKELAYNYPVDELSVDRQDIPRGSVVEDGMGNQYYYGKEGQLWRAESEQVLNDYLADQGVPNKAPYLAHPDFVRGHYQPDDNGKFPTISKEDLGTRSSSQMTRPIGPGRDIKPEEIGLGSSIASGLRNFRSGSQRMLPQAREYLQGKGYKPSRIIEKGKSIFKNK